jgi:hypothetical protein
MEKTIPRGFQHIVVDVCKFQTESFHSQLVTCLILVFTCQGVCSHPADVVFAIDNSATLGSDKYQQLLSYIASVVENLNISETSGLIRIGALTFSDFPVIQFNLTTFQTRQQIAQKIRSLPYSGYGTNTAAALAVMINMFRWA